LFENYFGRDSLEDESIVEILSQTKARLKVTKQTPNAV